jgi:hypothetical protein
LSFGEEHFLTLMKTNINCSFSQTSQNALPRNNP